MRSDTGKLMTKNANKNQTAMAKNNAFLPNLSRKNMNDETKTRKTPTPNMEEGMAAAAKSTELVSPMKKKATRLEVGMLRTMPPIFDPNFSAIAVVIATAEPPTMNDTINCKRKISDNIYSSKIDLFHH